MLIPDSKPRSSVCLSVMTNEVVLRQSFGCVSNPVSTPMKAWEEEQSTLFDQRIFGATHPYTCACSGLVGEQFEGMICGTCGVKIAPPNSQRAGRKRRFGHIDLGRSISHPLFPQVEVRVIPVLPIWYRSSFGTNDLNFLYATVMNSVGQSPRPQESFGIQGLDLERALEALFLNTESNSPILYRGRVLRGLSYYAFSDEPCVPVNHKYVFVIAMSLTIVLE